MAGPKKIDVIKIFIKSCGNTDFLPNDPEAFEWALRDFSLEKNLDYSAYGGDSSEAPKKGAINYTIKMVKNGEIPGISFQGGEYVFGDIDFSNDYDDDDDDYDDDDDDYDDDDDDYYDDDDESLSMSSPFGQNARQNRKSGNRGNGGKTRKVGVTRKPAKVGKSRKSAKSGRSGGNGRSGSKGRSGGNTSVNKRQGFLPVLVVSLVAFGFLCIFAKTEEGYEFFDQLSQLFFALGMGLFFIGVADGLWGIALFTFAIAISCVLHAQAPAGLLFACIGVGALYRYFDERW